MNHLAILGTTASGKSSVAIAIARARSGVELVSIDSMQVYRGMDVGTAKPTVAEQAKVRHHLIDLVDPTQEFTVSLFQAAARDAIADIVARSATPVLVGGTGLHLRSVIDDLEIPGQFLEVRADLNADPDTEALHRRLTELDPVAASRMEPTNRRRIVRALEVTVGSGRPFSSFGPGLDAYPPTNFGLVGIRLPKATVDQRIADRYVQQLAEGFLDEVEHLATLDYSKTAGQALGYRELLAHVRGECGLDEAIDRAVIRTRQFARRQDRWFRRDPRIAWIDVDDPADAVAPTLELFDRNPMEKDL